MMQGLFRLPGFSRQPFYLPAFTREVWELLNIYPSAGTRSLPSLNSFTKHMGIGFKL